MIAKNKLNYNLNVKDSQYCPIIAAIDNNSKWVLSMEQIQKQQIKEKKRVVIKRINKNHLNLKIFSIIGVSLLFSLFFFSFCPPNFIEAIMAIIKNFDPFSTFRGNGRLSPNDYVMFFNK